MTTLDDLNRFNFAGIGAAATPALMGTGSSAGASNPLGSFFQSQTRSDPWNMGSESPDLRNVTAGLNNQGMPGLGFNIPTFQLGLSGLNTLGNLWMAWQANKLAKEQFNFQKSVTNTNLANQMQAYNTTLEDRTRSRAFTEGMSAEDAQAYIDANRLRKQ